MPTPNTILLRLSLSLTGLLLNACELNPATAKTQAEPVKVKNLTAAIPDTLMPSSGPTGVESSITVVQQPVDLWYRIRNGYKLTPKVLPESVIKQRDWYLRNPSYLKTVFNRAEPFIFYITDELDRAGLPLELALLPIVESTYDPLAYSHSHAVGLWQFIPSTAKSFGLQRDRWHDERRDVIKSTQAAITYLKYLHDRFDSDWLLALAAYNSGEGTVRKAIRKNIQLGAPSDFWSITLPRETKNYVPQLLALATLIKQPQDFDIVLPTMPNSAYFEVVEINAQIDLNKIVAITGVEGPALTKLNPAYRRSVTPPRGKQHILLPVGHAKPLRTMLATTDAKTWAAHTEYQVESGDTLSHIALRYRIPTSWLKKHNRLTHDRLKVNQILLIPHSGEDLATTQNSATNSINRISIYSVIKGDSLSKIATQFNGSVAALRRTNNLSTDVLQIGQKLRIEQAAEVAPTHRRKLSYRVRRGDSLYLIAEKFDLRIKDITRWNNINRHEFLQPGQRLTLFINALRI